MQRNVYLNRSPVFVFRLGEPNTAIANMLRAEPNGILAAATRVEQQIERQTCLASDQMFIAKLSDLIRGPRVDKFVRSELRPQPYFASSGHANVEPDVAVAVNILDQKLETHLHVPLLLIQQIRLHPMGWRHHDQEAPRRRGQVRIDPIL